eukprot:g3183.t1
MQHFQLQVLDAHNKLRARHGAPFLEWDDECARTAQIWAEKMRSSGSFARGGFGNYGQNIAASMNLLTPQRAVDIWYAEGRFYNYELPKPSIKTADFTQLLWRSTSKVGAGVSKCPSGLVYFVAHYSTAGNVDGKYEMNVFRPVRREDDDMFEADSIVPPPPPHIGEALPPPPPPTTPFRTEEQQVKDEWSRIHGKGNLYLREAVLSKTSPVPLDGFGRSLLLQKSRSPNEVKKKIPDWAKKQKPFIVRGNKNAKTEQESDGKEKFESWKEIKYNQPITESYWDAALQLVRFRPKKGKEKRKRQATAAATSVAKIRATKQLVVDPGMDSLTKEMEKQFLSPVEVPSAVLQQLRGIFASLDDNQDGFLTPPQLEQALIALGVNPTPPLLDHFMMLTRTRGLVDLATFVYVFTKTRGSGAVKDCSRDILELFSFLKNGRPLSEEEYKKTKGKNIPDFLRTVQEKEREKIVVSKNLLKHVLSDVAVPNKLTPKESDDFMLYVDAILKGTTNETEKTEKDEEIWSPKKNGEEIDVENLIEVLCSFKTMG